MSVTKVLIISKDLRFQGGVTSFINMLNESISDSVRYEHFRVGSRYPEKCRLCKLFWPFVDNARLFFRLLSKDKIDCVHINPSLNPASFLRDGMLLVTMSLVGFKKVIVFFHGWDEQFAKRIANNPLYRRFFFATYGRAYRVVVLASSIKKQLISMGMESNRIFKTTTMFEGKYFQEQLNKSERSGPRLVFLSRFIKAKGVHELLAAFKVVRRENASAQLVLIGDGPELGVMKEFVLKHNLEDSVLFEGFLQNEDKINALKSSDLFVFPSYGEGCPISVIEAMAAGLPILATRVGGIPDIVIDKENGVLLFDTDSSKLADTILDMLKNMKYWEKIGTINKKIAWEKYEAAVVTGEIESLYFKAARSE